MRLASALMVACNGGIEEKPEDTEEDTQEDTETATETGSARLYYVGDFVTSDGAFTAARFGFAFQGLESGGGLCENTGALTIVGEPPGGCPDCTWAFDLSGITGSQGEGAACEAFEFGTDGSLDGQVDYAWGFAESYDYDYDGTLLHFTDVIFLYTDMWFPFAANLPESGAYQVYGDATSLTFRRSAYDATGAPIYYEYPSP